MVSKIEGLYLIHPYPCKTNNENIFKIGRSHNLYKRISSYDNGSICYLAIECLESKIDETKLIKLFNSKYKNNKFYGKEYFEGDKDDMILTIKKYVRNKYSKPRMICQSFEIMSYDKDNKYIMLDKRKIYKIFSDEKYKNSIISARDDKKLNLDELNNTIEFESEESINMSESETNESDIESNDNLPSGCGNLDKIIKSNTKPYICSICCKKFNSPSHLKRHNENKNGCKRPDVNLQNLKDDKFVLNFFVNYIKTMSTKNDINNDFKKQILISLQNLINDEINKILESELASAKSFMCNYCNQAFSQRQGLYKHKKYNRCKVKKEQSAKNE